MTVRIGLVGAGLVANGSHLPAYEACPDAQVVAVASGTIAHAQEAVERYGGKVHERWEDLVVDPDVDAVDVCTTNALHAPVAIAAARAGKHVIVEKPMATSVAEADAMTAAARDSGVLLTVAHNLRFSPVFEAVRTVVRNGTIGRPFTVRGVFMHAGPDESWGARTDWFFDVRRSGGGAMIDLGIHMIDIVRWVIGRPVLEVTAMTSHVLKPGDAEDNAILVMRFEGDVLGCVQSGWTARPFPDRSIMVHGEEGHVTTRASRTEPVVVNLRGDRRITPEIPSQSPNGNPFSHFVSCIREGLTPVVTAQDARDSLAVAMAGYQSAREGRTVRL